MTERTHWLTLRPPFTAAVVAAAAAHARAEAPRESVGLVVGGRYRAVDNVADDPAARFEIAPEDYAAALSDGVQAVIHSHPSGPGHPSEADMRGQIGTAVPWAIVSGEGLLCIWGDDHAPALFDAAGRHRARGFLHGVSDCYTIIRDWWRERRGVTLPEIPRQWDWWSKGGDLYLQNFGHAGFRVLSRDPTEFARLARPGDVALRPVCSPVPNHGGVVCDGGLFLDQRWRMLSVHQPAGRVLPCCSHLLRRDHDAA
ncbi:MAG: Mov34/MPN/PAD-1 family protein [Pseudomonadota bacterium]